MVDSMYLCALTERTARRGGRWVNRPDRITAHCLAILKYHTVPRKYEFLQCLKNQKKMLIWWKWVNSVADSNGRTSRKHSCPAEEYKKRTASCLLCLNFCCFINICVRLTLGSLLVTTLSQLYILSRFAGLWSLLTHWTAHGRKQNRGSP